MTVPAATPALVTGATGFIGSHLVDQLLARGESVRVLVRNPARLAEVGLAPGPRLQVVQGDLLDPRSIHPALAGVDRVYHVAGYISTDRRERKKVHELNYDVTVNLFEAIERAGIARTVYLASIFALGGGGALPVRECASWDLAPMRIDYIEAKRNAELYAYRCRDRGMPLLFVYPCFCYGPGDVHDSSSRLLTAFLRRTLPAYVDGGQNAMDVRDAARVLILAMDRGRPGEKYLIGGENLSFADLFARLAALTGYPPPRLALPPRLAERAGQLFDTVSLRLGDRFPRLAHLPLDEQAARLASKHWYYDDRKARRELGHTSRPLDETLRDAITWFCETGRTPWPPRLAPARAAV